MNAEESERLNDWVRQLCEQLGIDENEFRGEADIDRILSLAGVVAHAVLRPAAPLTTYLVGYAAGRAVEAGKDPAAAVQEAISRAVALTDAG